MNGQIKLDGIRVFAHHGVFPEERQAGQTFVIDVTMHLDLEPAVTTDDLTATIDYGALAQAIHDRVADESWGLIERVAGRVADLVMEDKRVEVVEVTVHKPEAPITVPFDDVSVTIRRSR
ncbi:MAG: dihydroneopterin aldolase [Gammaproteobacteria bacterium]|nr:dihydroneopterin aldolase [Gammaproteobacteria bacterium]